MSYNDYNDNGWFVPVVFFAFWLASAAAGLGFIGLVCWAIYRFVVHYT
jgi:hypothetical protein